MKGKKIIVPLLLAGMTATGVVTNVEQKVSVQAQDTAIVNVAGAELQVKNGFSDSYKVGDPVYLPDVSTNVGEVEYEITKGNKTVKVLEDGQGKKYFEAKYVGYYNVSISAVEKNGEGEITRVVSKLSNLSVWVEKDDAVINLPTNNEYVIPAKVPVKQEGLKIPAPTVTVEESGEEVEKTARELGTSLVVRLVTPSNSQGEVLTLTQDTTNTENPNDYYAVNKDLLASAGTYQIVYEYKNGNSIISRLESNFQVVNEYDLDKIKLTMKILDTVPSTGNVCTDISIPKIKVTESASSLDEINTKVTVTVTNLRTGETVDVDYDNYTFHPTKEGYYTVTYKASIPLFGKETAEVTPDQTIEVKDKQAPTLLPTYAYELNKDNDNNVVSVNGNAVISVNGQAVAATQDKTAKEVAEEMLVNRKVDVPSVAILKADASGVKSVKVKVPAVYATDNFDNYEDITITRTYKTSSGTVSTINTPANEVAEIEFKTKGNHEIRFKATDKAGNTLGDVVYDIVVYDVDEDLSDGKTKINLNVGTDAVSDKEGTLEFAKPTATDTYDSEVEVKTFYKLVKAGVEQDAIELVETNDDGKYEIDVTPFTDDITAIKIYSEAYLDSTLVGTRDGFETEAKVTTDVYEVQVIHSNGDIVAPDFMMGASTDVTAQMWNASLIAENTIVDEDKGRHDITIENAVSIDDKGYALDINGDVILNSQGTKLAAFDQGNDIIYLPEVKFSENYDNNLKITVTITDKFGNVVSKIDQETISRSKEAPYVYTVSGASFKLSSYGVYTVTYSAQDIGGNATVKSFGIRVNDKTTPTITIDDEDKFGKEVEVGDYFRVPTAKLVKNGETVKGTITWDIYKVSDGAQYTKQTNGFIPLTEGTFFISYSAIDEYGNVATLEDSMFTVTAKDSVAPTIELDLTYHLPTSMDWAPAENEDYMNIDIPVAFATDKLTKKDLEVVYTVTGPNGVKPTVSEYDDETKDYIRYFKATSEGTYTIKYYAIDEAGNETTITKTLAIGDCEKPTLTWDNQDTDLPTEVKLNEEFTLDLSKITFSDNETTEADLIDNVTITLTDPSGSTVTNKGTDGVNYKWEFTKTGSYTLKFVVKDNVGNSNTYTYSITVPSEEAESDTISPVLGTVLVVLSVVVLAGVVIYFVASSKKKSAKTTKKSNKKSK